MRKNDIKTDGTVYMAERRYSSPFKVVVVDNEVYHTVRMNNARVDRDVLAADEGYVTAHLAWALTQAFPQDTTPKEARAAIDGLREEESRTQREWFNADPMRKFRKGETYRSRWDSADQGILCRTSNSIYDPLDPDKDHEVSDELTLVARRDIKMTWEEHVKQTKAARKANAEQTRRQEAYRKERDAALVEAQRFLIDVLGFEGEVGRVLTVGEGDDKRSMYLGSSYKPFESLTPQEFVRLLKDAYAKGQVHAALATTRKEGQPA